MKTQFVGTMTNYIQTNRGMGKKNINRNLSSRKSRQKICRVNSLFIAEQNPRHICKISYKNEMFYDFSDKNITLCLSANYFCNDSKPAQHDICSNFIFGKDSFSSSYTKYISSSSHSSPDSALHFSSDARVSNATSAI